MITYLVGETVKTIPINNKWIPIICGCTGGVLGIIAMRIMPNFPATDYITALAIGIASGFSATGVNEALKLVKNHEN